MGLIYDYRCQFLHYVNIQHYILSLLFKTNFPQSPRPWIPIFFQSFLIALANLSFHSLILVQQDFILASLQTACSSLRISNLYFQSSPVLPIANLYSEQDIYHLLMQVWCKDGDQRSLDMYTETIFIGIWYKIQLKISFKKVSPASRNKLNLTSKTL